MKDSIIISQADESQLLKVSELTYDGILHWGGHIFTDIEPWVRTTCDLSKLAELRHKGYLLVAIDGSEIVGTASGSLGDDGWVLGGIYVSKKNCGIGHELALQVLKEGYERGYKIAYSYVYEHNVGSLKFLKRFGAVEVDDEVTVGHRYIKVAIELKGNLL